MVAPEIDNLRITALLVCFRAAAIKWFLCHELYLEDDKAKARGAFEAIVQELDSFTSDGRAALIPLLQDNDKGVQVIAASQLLDTRPEIALPALRDLEDSYDTDVGFTAAMVLLEYEFEQRDFRAASEEPKAELK